MGCWASKPRPRASYEEPPVGRERKKDGDDFFDIAGGAAAPAAPLAAQTAEERKAERKRKMENFVVSDKQGEIIVRKPGDISGQQFVAMNCRDCVIVVLDHIDSAQIDDCVGCRVFLGPASGSVFVRDCSGTALVSVCQQFRSRDCSGMDVALHCRSKPVLESCREMRFGCCDVEYPEMGDHMRAAGLDILHNFWPSVYDFTADELKPGERSWDVLPPFSNGEDLLRLKELRETHGGGLQLSGGVPNKPLRHVLKTMGPNARLGSSYGDSAVVVLVGQGRGPRDAAVEVAREVQEHLLSLVNCNWMAGGAGDALSGLEGAIGAELVAAVAQGATAAVEAFGPNCRESVGKALAAVRAESHGAKAHILTGGACEAFCKAFMGLGLDEGTRLG